MGFIWELFDGKKTNVGATMLVVALAMTNLGDIWGWGGVEWFDNIIASLNWIGGILTPGGLIHKGIKKAKQ